MATGRRTRTLTLLARLLDVLARTFRLLRYSFRFLSEAVAPGTLWLLALSTLLLGVLAVLSPYVAMRLIEAIIAAQQTHAFSEPLGWLGVELGVVVLSAVGGGAVSYFSLPLKARGEVRLVSAVLSKACGIAYSNFEKQEFANKLALAKDSTGEIVPFLLGALSILRASVIFLGCMLLLMSTWPWAIPLAVLLALPSYFLHLSRARREFDIEADNTPRSRQRWYLEWLITSEWTAKEIRAFQAGRWMVSMYQRVCAPGITAKLELAREYRSRELALEGFGILGRYGPLSYVIFQAVLGQVSLGSMLLFTLAFPACSAALHELLASMSGMAAKGMRVQCVVDFLMQEEATDQLGENESLLEMAPELVIEDLWFSYPGHAEPILRGVNLRIKAGETLALVGENGAGKTTLVKVLLGLYPIQKGRILLGGIDVSQRSVAWRQRNVGVIFQDFGRFHFSARENVGIGWLDAARDEAQLWRALEKADAEALVKGFSEGLDTALGPAFGGCDLSGGQWQRIALARLFMRKSRLWVLDEPSAAMDPESEERTFRRFQEWTTARTALIISHRLSTVMLAHRIAVIHQGEVVQVGSHDKLVSDKGRYTQLFPALTKASDDPRGSSVAM